MDTSKLAPETLHVWEFLAKQTELGGFTLIGGTALAMHIQHRISEDLDFIVHAAKLPRTAIRHLVTRMENDGFVVEADDNPDAVDDFLIAGMDLHDHQQNFIVNGVKLNIFAPDSDLAAMVAPSEESLPRVASLSELFHTKALASANRCVSRDWIDLYILFRDHGFSLADFTSAFRREGVLSPESRIDRAFGNLCRGVKSSDDPGYATLMENPPTLEEIAEFFRAMRNEYETTAGCETFRRKRFIAGED